MLNVTENAAKTLHETLQENRTEETQVLRLTSSQDGLGLALDTEQEGDQIVEHEQEKVLVVAPAIAEALTGATFDAVDTPEGKRLVLQSPDGQSQQ